MELPSCSTSGAAQGKCLDRIPALKDYWFDWRKLHPDQRSTTLRNLLRIEMTKGRILSVYHSRHLLGHRRSSPHQRVDHTQRMVRSNTFVSTKRSFTRGTRWWSRRLSAARFRSTISDELVYRNRPSPRRIRDYMFSLSQRCRKFHARARSPIPASISWAHHNESRD